MKAGNRCSYQLHHYKEETNVVVAGGADVLLEGSDGVEFMHNIVAGQGWHVLPNRKHRVFARQDYTAFEASTPEVDDVIRLADDTGRESGRIAMEHNRL